MFNEAKQGGLGIQDGQGQIAASNQAKCGVGREMTIGELLDRRIDKAERLLRTLQDLKNALPGQFLNSGAYRISALLEVQ